jgi:tetratricopeptide (TPR) repeat protein
MASLLSHVVLGAGLAAAAMVRGPTIAAAQPAPKPAAPSDADKQAAKQLTKDGIEAQNAGENDKAVELYKKAYARFPHPVLLANIALAHRKAGHGDEALTYYERYLEADPDGPEAGPSRVAISQLKRSRRSPGARRIRWAAPGARSASPASCSAASGSRPSPPAAISGCGCCNSSPTPRPPPTAEPPSRS